MKITSFFLLLIVSTFSAFSQENYDSDLIPANLKNRANATIRIEETTIDMRSPENVLLNVKQAITVLNKNGEDNARLVLFYDKNTFIKGVKGEVYNASGILTGKFSQNDFTDESAASNFSLFEDSRVKHYLPSVSVYPYTIVYNYEIRFKQNLIIPDWTPKPGADVSVEKSSYTFICKPTDELRIKAQNFGGQPEEIVNEKQKSLTWKINNILAVRPEPYGPIRDSYQTSIKIAAKQFSYFNHKATYSNWKELGKWVYDDLLKERTTLPVSTIQTIKDLVKDENTDEGKARKIYQYMQDKTRYISVQIGIGGFQPVAAADVDRLGYGDCKALVNYMQSLLKGVNIDSYYCVVEAGNQKVSLDPDYASMVQGNHVILCLPLKGDTTWLECTSQKIPFGFLSSFTDDRIVLACTPDGGKLMRTPKLTTANNLQIRNAEFNILSNGSIKGNINTIYSGSQYDNQEDLIGKPFTEQQKLLKETYDTDNINFNKISLDQKKEKLPKLTENLSVDISAYASINADKMFLKLNAFNIKSLVPEFKNRSLPLYLNRGYTDEDTIVYNLPDEVLTKNISNNDKKIITPFGEYISKTSLEGRKLTYYRKLIMNDGTFPADHYAAFYNFVTDVNSADQLKIILSLKK